MAISINPILPVLPAAETAAIAPELLLQPGTVVDATVLKVLAADLVRIAIASLSIDVRSEIPLQEGQVLRLSVSQTPEGIRLVPAAPGDDAPVLADAVMLSPDAPVGRPAQPAANQPPRPVLTPPERLAVTIAARAAAPVQESQAPLFANLAVAASSGTLPPGLQQAITQVLGQRPNLDPNLSGSDIEAAFQKSGLFLEASLAARVPDAAPTAGVPDLKAALIVLRQTLQAALGGTPAAAQHAGMPSEPPPLLRPDTIPGLAPPGAENLELQEILLPQARLPVADDLGELHPAGRTDFFAASNGAPIAAATSAKAPAVTASLNLLQESALQATASPTRPPPTPPRVVHDGDVTVHTNTPPPPFRGALPSAQPVAAPSLPPHAPLATAAHHLLRDTDAALARQTLLQVASLPDRPETPGVAVDAAAPRWSFEIPFAVPQGTAMAQFEISRDGGGTEVDAAKRVWRARFSLDIEPAGPVHALVALIGDKTSVRIWAERPATAAQLRAGAVQLSQALSRAELTPGDIVIRDGAPPSRGVARAGHFLDRAL